MKAGAGVAAVAGGLALACSNPFGGEAPTDEAAGVDTDVVVPVPEPAPEPDKPVREQVERLTTPVGDETRVSWLHLPAGADKVPLVVVLHGGRDGDGRAMGRKVDHWFDDGVAFLFPNGRPAGEREGKAGKEKGKHKAGDDEDDDRGVAWQGDEDQAFLELLVNQVVTNRPVDPERVYVVGFASGGEMAWRLACRSTVFDGFASISAGLEREVAKTCPMPGFPAKLLVIQATEDRRVMWTGDEHVLAVTETLAKFGAKNGCDLTTKDEVLLDDLDPEDGVRVRRQQWTCTDGGLRLFELTGRSHGWPRAGEDADKGRGEACHDIDAMDEIGAFFALK